MLQNSIDTLNNRPITFNITKCKGYKGRFISKLEFMPVNPGTMFNIQPLIAQLPDLGALLDDKDIEVGLKDQEIKFLKGQPEQIMEHQKLMIEILCWAYWNRPGEFPGWYRDYFTWNLGSYQDLYTIFRAIVSRANVQSFLSSTILTKNGMGLITKEEIIASLTRAQY